MHQLMGYTLKPLNLSGLGNPNNYGGRILMVDKNDLYVGTANPFQGCEVLKTNKASFVNMLYHCQNPDYDNIFSKTF